MPSQTPASDPAAPHPATYTFTTAWTHPGDPEALFDVLADVAAYPDWWPQVRAVARVDDDTARVVCRSFLPYRLDLVLTRSVEDRGRGVLEADIGGALTGWSRWTLESGMPGTSPGTRLGTRLGYEQVVSVSSPALSAASRVMRPALVANHAWMMRGGRRGLLSHAPARAGGDAR